MARSRTAETKKKAEAKKTGKRRARRTAERSRKRAGRFRKLAWKLTVSHTLTTVAAFVMLELLAVVVLYGLLLISANETLQNVPAALAALSPRLAPTLAARPADPAALQAALERVETLRNPDNPSFAAALPRVGQNAVLIVDTSGSVVARSNPQALSLGTLLGEELPAEGAELLRGALAGEAGAGALPLSLLRPLMAAAPLRSTAGKVVGAALFYSFTLSREQVYGSTFVLVLASFLVFLIFATPVGALVGAARARSLTRRLERLKEAANAWSRGDFSALVRDTSQDELGELTQQLNSMAKELQTLVQTRQQLATLEERQRIARDLHDSVKQQLFAATLQIGAARLQLERDPATGTKHLLKAEGLATQARAELTRLLRALRPPELEDESLAGALETLARGWTEQRSMLLVTRLDDAPELPPQLEQVLYRVAQEALANAVKHSQARQVEVSLSTEDGEAVMTIRDDGRGFRPGRVRRKGFGLRSMHERLEGVGGQLLLWSRPGRGTMVTARVPLGGEE